MPRSTLRSPRAVKGTIRTAISDGSASRSAIGRRTALRTLVSVSVGAGVGLLAGPASLLSEAVAAPAGSPRYFIRLRAVEMAAGINASVGNDALKSMAKENLLEALGKRPEVVMNLEGVPAETPAERFSEELKRRKLKGYEVTLNITKLDRQVMPPPAGRKFRLLEQSIKLSLVGTLWPGEPTLALGGDGESTVQIEVGVQISENQDRDVLVDVVKDAVGQAVTQALRKLEIGPMKPPKDPPRRRKK